MDEKTEYTSYVVRDPRNGKSASTMNPALIAYDLLRQRATEKGLKIDVDSFIDAADRCDHDGVVVSRFFLIGAVFDDVAAVTKGTPVNVVVGEKVVSANFERTPKKRKKLT